MLENLPSDLQQTTSTSGPEPHEARPHEVGRQSETAITWIFEEEAKTNNRAIGHEHWPTSKYRNTASRPSKFT